MSVVGQGQRIFLDLTQQLRSGELKPGDKLPSERFLAESYHVSRATLRDGLQRVADQGLIYRANRRGWFVAPPRVRYQPAIEPNFHQMVSAAGGRPKTQTLEKRIVPATATIAAMLDVDENTLVFYLRRLRYIDDRAVCCAESYVRADQVPGLLDCNTDGSMTEIYQQQFNKTYGKIDIQLYPTALNQQIAEALLTVEGASALLIKRLNKGLDGQVIDYELEWWCHDAITVCFSGGV
ncbi:DNA-binding GntR family transcriptional regulator [Sinobacterium caligoides]|uniref:DNA-binding GntR family transcriptional regulator n=1 Tax=Sinobacterium caligoides TaxID=933926 RepID=A0A3N2DZY7_9GAMM|nr:UTRA domain-containing protein [Sinobacterium caligoides]ROS05426.1 DNA-binding GntR family transcriptional regulator [Sinobacterium caligoides]